MIMKYRLLLLPLLAAVTVTAVHADDPYDAFKKQMEEGYSRFSQKTNSEYDTFRDQINTKYAEFLADPWQETKKMAPVPAPVNPEPEPVYKPDDDTPSPRQPRPVVIEEEIAIPAPAPAPEPIGPIRRDDRSDQKGKLMLFGAQIDYRYPSLGGFSLSSAGEKDVSRAWQWLAQNLGDGLLQDCLTARDRLALPDWGYFLMVNDITGSLKGSGSPEQVLLMGYVLNQSGYMVRFCRDSRSNLHLLFASESVIYDRYRYEIDNRQFYPFTMPEGGVSACNFSTPGERPLSMRLRRCPELPFAAGVTRNVTVVQHPDLKLTVTTNRNLIDLYDRYPECGATFDSKSKWLIQGETPASKEIREQLYPTLRNAVQGLSQNEAVNLLLKVCQSFPYAFDNDMWGHDRVFWMDESWFYPKSDCEDHAINFTRMVRDVLGLDCCLIYYPGHLSAAVAMTDGTAKGDYFDYNGCRYTVCDATYLYGDAGETPDQYVGVNAYLIPLKK